MFKIFSILASITFITGVFAKNSLENLDDDTYILGKSFFEKPWVASPASTTARDGLGPLFNENACINCHPTTKHHQVSRSNKFILTLQNPHTAYGKQIATKSTGKVPKEADITLTYAKSVFTYPNGEKITLRKPIIHLTNLGYGTLTSSVNMRIAPDLNGVGLLEQIPNKPHKRFNLTASAQSILEQVANAAFNDMGLTNVFHKQESCTTSQTQCNNAPKSTGLDLPTQRLHAITYFVQQQRSVSNIKPTPLFTKIGCTNCHTPSYKLEQKPNAQTIYPYTDLLTHNMGEGFFRTAPLWNSKFAPNFWHDGRAKTVEEAILWHNRQSIKKFINLDTKDRRKIIKFIKNL